MLEWYGPYGLAIMAIRPYIITFLWLTVRLLGLVLSALRERHKSCSSTRSVDSSAYGSVGSYTGDDILDSELPVVSKEEIMREIHYTVCQLYCQERIPFANDASGLFLQFFFYSKII